VLSRAHLSFIVKKNEEKIHLGVAMVIGMSSASSENLLLRVPDPCRMALKEWNLKHIIKAQEARHRDLAISSVSNL
jgi:hypothetical protein